MLAAPLNSSVLQALGEGPKQQSELRRAAGSPALTTLRAQLQRMIEMGAISKSRLNHFPGVLEYELERPGRDLLSVASVLECWLSKAPDGPLSLGEGTAKAAIKALAESWSTAMMRALAIGPLSLTELDRVISPLSYPALERRLSALRLAGLVEACSGTSRGTPYAVTTWLREGVAPLAAAARWERKYLPTVTAPVSRLDIEAAFLLAVPLTRTSADLSGSCRMATELADGKARRLAGVLVEVEDGGIVSCATDLRGNPGAWILGSVAAWLNAVLDRDVDHLELGGDSQLARSLLYGLHETLFAARPSLSP